MNDFKARYDNTDPIIRDHVLYAMGAGLIPIPMLDIAAVTAIQLDMIRQLCNKKGVDFTETQGKAWVAALTGSSLSRLAAGFVKLIPGVGTILGGVTMSVLSGASTFAVGRVAEDYLAKGKSIFDSDIAEAKVKYDEAFEEGKKAAETWKKEADAKKKAPNHDEVYADLEKLGKLKDSGVLTQEEFDGQKEKTARSDLIFFIQVEKIFQLKRTLSVRFFYFANPTSHRDSVSISPKKTPEESNVCSPVSKIPGERKMNKGGDGRK